MRELCKKVKEIKSINPALIQTVEAKLADWEAEKVRCASTNKMQVACVGIYNAGKSTLLNSLIGKQVFVSGDVPTTDSLDKYDAGDVVYIDTPGLNANDTDNATAFSGYKESDVILFVSNIQNGGLNAAEARYLEELKMALGNAKMLEDNVVFILSNKHRVDAANVEKIVEQHKKNIEDVFGIGLSNVYVCDAVTYESGVAQNQGILIEASGITEIKEKINELLSRKTSVVRQERAVLKKAELESALLVLEDEVRQKAELLNQGTKTVSSQLEELEKLKADCKKGMQSFKQGLTISEEVPRPYYIRFEPIPSVHGKKSEYDVKSYIRTKVENRYNKRESMVRQAVSELSEYYLRYLEYNKQEGNYFYEKNTAATKLILEYASQLKQYGVKVPADLLKEIQFMPENTKDIIGSMSRDLADDVVEYGQYYSVSYYADQVDIDEQEDYSRKGLFGSTKYKYSAYNTYAALDEMEKDLNGNLNGNIRSLWNRIRNIINKYNENVNKELEDKIKKLEQLIESHKAVLKNSKNQAEHVTIAEVVQLLDQAVKDLRCA